MFLTIKKFTLKWSYRDVGNYSENLLFPQYYHKWLHLITILIFISSRTVRIPEESHHLYFLLFHL